MCLKPSHLHVAHLFKTLVLLYTKRFKFRSEYGLTYSVTIKNGCFSCSFDVIITSIQQIILSLPNVVNPQQTNLLWILCPMVGAINIPEIKTKNN